MTFSNENKRQVVGTPAYDNWQSFLASESHHGTFEYSMYSDAWLSGEVTTGLGPYQFINLIPITRQIGKVRATVVVRVSEHIQFDVPNMEKTDQSRYHGGGMIDELAALTSLTCGVRFRSGGETRRFSINGDPKGRPVLWDIRPKPTLSIGLQGFVLPAVTGSHSLMLVEQFKAISYALTKAGNSLSTISSALPRCSMAGRIRTQSFLANARSRC